MEARESVMLVMTASSESERLARGADREVAPVLWWNVCTVILDSGGYYSVEDSGS